MSGFCAPPPPFLVAPSGDTTGSIDTAIIQAALTAATPSAGAVVLTPGVYYLRAPIVVGPLGTTGSPGVPQPAPSLVALSSAGHIGDNAFPTDKSAVELVAASTFPSGKYMIDYQQTANGGGPSGAVIGGFTMACQSLSAGMRLQAPRRFHVKDVSIAGAATPSGYTDGSQAAFECSYNGAATAAAWNQYENISIMSAANHGLHHNVPSQDVFLNVNVMNSGGTNWILDSLSQATILGGSSQGNGTAGVHGWYITGAGINVIGASTETAGSRQAAIQLGGQGTPSGSTNQVNFISCQFVSNPAVAFAEHDASIVDCLNAYHGVKFVACEFQATTNTQDWVYVAAGATGYVEFHECSFDGTPTNTKFNDLSGNNILRFSKCRGINPVGVVTPAVPTSGSAVAAQPYDRMFYVSTVAGTTSCSMAVQGGTTVPFIASTAQVVAVHVLAGQTVTPTYTGTAPTWMVGGE